MGRAKENLRTLTVSWEMAEGSSVGNVSRASEQADYSHFISLPLAVHPGLVEKLQNFQNSILGNLDSSQDLGIDKSIFINPKTFHLTVLMLKLWNEERVAAAAEVLQKVSPKVMKALKDRPISIRLKGLDCMRGSVSEACVLYTPVEEIGGEGRLMRACQVIIDAYVKAGLVLQKDACRKLKLHGTVMNVKFRKRTVRTRKIGSFDAHDIFEQYGSEEWGEYVIGEAHLSQRFKYDRSGYYHRCASIPFP
ncbi:hypothetical protein AMTR_s00109p00142690 [Amborella trichopoda]|uniref:A-kinase anchor protein 7-like phosphoesterase domain-containing protein n=1 Tax=Amborella trichopoda TaxID=13333 RepID=W1NU13_AMBTC|nr:hypothetical protein AMTR_s00109p00142690 [Amborella trichopoda]